MDWSFFQLNYVTFWIKGRVSVRKSPIPQDLNFNSHAITASEHKGGWKSGHFRRANRLSAKRFTMCVGMPLTLSCATGKEEATVEERKKIRELIPRCYQDIYRKRLQIPGEGQNLSSLLSTLEAKKVHIQISTNTSRRRAHSLRFCCCKLRNSALVSLEFVKTDFLLETLMQ